MNKTKTDEARKRSRLSCVGGWKGKENLTTSPALVAISVFSDSDGARQKL